MPLAMIKIEQIEVNRWWAEVEIGGFMAKRQEARGNSYDEIMTAVRDTYAEMLPVAVKRSAAVETAEAPAADVLAQDRMPAALFVTPHAAGERRATDRASGPDGEREALVAAAAARGIEVDRRWGLPRLREALRAT